MKVLSEIGAIIVAVISGFWLNSQPGPEPLIVFLGPIGAIVVQVNKRFRSRDITTLLGRTFSPIMRWVDRRRPVASFSYDTLSGTNSVRHEVRAWAIWDDIRPTLKVELRHKISRDSWSALELIKGHHIEFEARDIDADGNPELLVRYDCGAHTHVVKAY